MLWLMHHETGNEKYKEIAQISTGAGAYHSDMHHHASLKGRPMAVLSAVVGLQVLCFCAGHPVRRDTGLSDAIHFGLMTRAE